MGDRVLNYFNGFTIENKTKNIVAEVNFTYDVM